MKLSSLVPIYEQQQRSVGRRERGITRYLQHLHGFLATLPEGATPEDITRAAIRAHQRERAAVCKPSTVQGSLTAIRSFCRFLMEEELIDADPTLAIRYPKRTPYVPRALNNSELRALLEAIQEPPNLPERARRHWQRNRRAIFLMLYAGLRLSEAAALLWADVELEDGTLLVREGKGGKARSLPIHPCLKRELCKKLHRPPEHAVCGNPDGRPMKGKALAHLFERWLPRLGIVGISAHRLRHTFATRMLKAGAELCDIQIAMGHSRLDTTSIYLSIDAERIRVGVAKLPDWENGE